MSVILKLSLLLINGGHHMMRALLRIKAFQKSPIETKSKQKGVQQFMNWKRS